MKNNATDQSFGEGIRINVNDSLNLKYWAKRLEVSENELRETVERIGPAADAVSEYLGK